MQLNKPVKVLIGLATLWFVLYPFLFLIVWLTMAAGLSLGPLLADAAGMEVPLFSMVPFMAVFPLHLCTICIQFALLAFYLAHVIKNTEADETVRIILGIGNFYMPFLSMPVYYYAFIWRDTPPEWALPRTTPAARKD
ncbi:MAG: hypothetical protein JXA13_01470 [Anaerolineales bacterium]|nr:hypothetical protein [Anaerolineales bacterium]